MTMKSVSRPRASNGLTTAYCEASPSPVSPTTRNETSSRSACRSRIRSFCSFPVSCWILIQRRRSALVGSSKMRLRYWLRESQIGTGFIQEKAGPPVADTLRLLHRHPAPTSDSREELASASGRAPGISPPCLSPVDTSNPLSLYSASKEPPRELVGEFAIGVVFLREIGELREVLPVQLLHIGSGKALAVLPKVRTGPDLLQQFFGGCVELLEAARVVADEVYPSAAAITACADQGAVVSLRGEPHLEERVRQPRRVHLLVEPDELAGGLERVLERDRELQLLVQVIDRPVEGPVALQHQVRPQLEAVSEE